MKFKSSLTIFITGEHAERFLNFCSHHSIKLNNIIKTDDGYYASMDPACFFSLKHIIKKTNVKIKIIAKEGIVFWFDYIKKHTFFLVFPFFCWLILVISSNYLWNVRIEGNQSITEDMIKDYLCMEGLYYGMPLKDISMNRLKTDIRNEYPQINWVSVFLEGTTLQISIKENDNIAYTSNQIDRKEDIVSPVDGIVESIYIRKGTAMVTSGSEVKRGDILIEGNVDVPAEDGNVKETIFCKADGDINIIYHHNINEIIPLKYSTKEYTLKKIKKLEIIINNKSYIIPNTNIPFQNYETLSEEKNFPIFSIFSMPIRLNYKTYYEYYIEERMYTEDEGQKMLNDKLDEICKTFMEKGVQIIEKNVKIETNSVYSTMSGSLTLKVHCDNKTISEEHP